jgi:hypothetical protein
MEDGKSRGLFQRRGAAAAAIVSYGSKGRMVSCVLAASSSQDSIPMRGSDDPGYNFVCSAWAERKASLKMALHVGEHRAFVCCSMVF